jgi:hypothetical protein
LAKLKRGARCLSRSFSFALPAKCADTSSICCPAPTPGQTGGLPAAWLRPIHRHLKRGCAAGGGQQRCAMRPLVLPSGSAITQGCCEKRVDRRAGRFKKNLGDRSQNHGMRFQPQVQVVAKKRGQRSLDQGPELFQFVLWWAPQIGFIRGLPRRTHTGSTAAVEAPLGWLRTPASSAPLFRPRRFRQLIPKFHTC